MSLNKSLLNPKIFFIGVIVLAALLRITLLGSFPNGLLDREAVVGWRAQNLSIFGKDEFGRSFPLLFSNGLEIEMPLMSYLIVPFVALSQSSIFLLRLPFAILGILVVVGTIILTQKLFPQYKTLGLWTGLVMAISPAAIWFSRIVNVQIIVFCLIIWGLYFFYSQKKILGGILFGLACFTWSSSLIFILGLFIIVNLKSNSSKALIYFGLFLMGALILILIKKDFLLSLSQYELSLFKDSAFISDLNLLRGHNISLNLPNFLNSFYFNKSFYIITIFKNLISYLNPSYIFAKGDGQYENGMSNFGLMLVSMFPVFLIGLYNFVKQKSPNRNLILIWIILSTLSSLFIASTPDTKRFIFAIFPLSLITAFGFIYLNKKLKNLVIILILINLAIVSYDSLAKEIIRQQNVFHPESLNLLSFINKNTGGNVWLTDGIDTNLGPKIGYSSKIPFKDSNLKDDNKYIYRAKVNKIINISIGNKELLTKEPSHFNFALVSSEEEKPKCFEYIDSFGEGKNKYLLFKNNYCENEENR